MAINFQVRAQVVDLTRDRPKAEDKFWVDTNVWLWLVYPAMTVSMDDRRKRLCDSYLRYFRDATRAGSALHWCALQFSEIAHQIERTEFEAAKSGGVLGSDPKFKEYRHGSATERERVTGLIQGAWQDVCSNGAGALSPALQLDGPAAETAASTIAACALDGHDLFYLQNLQAAGVTQVLSDDGDFCTVSGITLFTIHGGVIAAARSQGKLIRR
ncbi:MAG: hypothetical protein JNM99_05555 [Verrucomicrobiaceae bacterium]|nr:hypothetical protein [Verrucomicrobiaceae bacterium]